MTRYSNVVLVKAKLLAEGHVEALDAVYHFTDPDGKPHRITRLAATIHTLRHQHGMDIETYAPPGKLATYTLRSRTPLTRATTLPAVMEEASVAVGKRGNGRDHRAVMTAPAEPRCPKPKCDRTLLDVRPALAPGWRTGRCGKHGQQMVR